MARGTSWLRSTWTISQCMPAFCHMPRTSRPVCLPLEVCSVTSCTETGPFSRWYWTTRAFALSRSKEA